MQKVDFDFFLDFKDIYYFYCAYFSTYNRWKFPDGVDLNKLERPIKSSIFYKYAPNLLLASLVPCDTA